MRMCWQGGFRDGHQGSTGIWRPAACKPAGRASVLLRCWSRNHGTSPENAQMGNLHGLLQLLTRTSGVISGRLADVLSPARQGGTRN